MRRLLPLSLLLIIPIALSACGGGGRRQPSFSDYSITTPAGWSADSYTAPDNKRIYYFPAGAEEYDSVWAEVDNNPNNQAAEEWARDLYRRESGGIEPEPGELNFSPIQIGSDSGTLVSGIPERVTHYMAVLSRGTRIYTWGLNGGIEATAAGSSPSHFEAFQQMLRSVKFAD